jgi:predicted amidohydrolase
VRALALGTVEFVTLPVTGVGARNDRGQSIVTVDIPVVRAYVAGLITSPPPLPAPPPFAPPAGAPGGFAHPRPLTLNGAANHALPCVWLMSARGGGLRMREPLVIAVAQPLCMPYDIAVNAATHAATVRSVGARVVVFPELSLTGYELDAPAIEAGDLRLVPIVEACASAGSVALVGAPVRVEAGRSHIALLAVDGAGVTLAYHKMWLGTDECTRFTPGGTPAVLDLDGWRLGLAICKDTGVPQHATDTAALGIDAYVAATLKSAEEAGLQAERARRVATHHRVWVAVASFAGSTGGGFAHAAGRSSILTPDGVVIAQAGPQPGAVARATLR